ncbi:MAG: glycoside hydrolase family 3 protein [Acidobacteria bacterium]|nr:glycoside hydrolase family 3 protein [Acidobacteriota bacterium]
MERRAFLKKTGKWVLGTGMASRIYAVKSSTGSGGDSLDQKIGRMVMVGFHGLTVREGHPVVEDIRAGRIGGVVFFDYDVPAKSAVRNIESPEQVKRLLRQLQSFADVPLFTAVDYEGGRISRLRPEFGFPETLSHHELGSGAKIEPTRKQGEAMGRLLSDLGFNLNLAPVVDVNINPDNPVIGGLGRSFSADPAAVTRHAAAFIKGHREFGVLCALKHFPGHGSSKGDSHLGLTDVTATWRETELMPYRDLIREGLTDAVMTAHVFNARLDPDYPATLSRAVITGILREKLGFGGVVISDDMQMGAIVEKYGFEEAVERAVYAGVDILTFANNSVFDEEIASKAVLTIKTLIRKGRIAEKRIYESYQRIIRLKGRLK